MQLQAHVYWNAFLLTVHSQEELEDSEVPLILVTESEKLEQVKIFKKCNLYHLQIRSSSSKLMKTSIDTLLVLSDFWSIVLYFINIYY